MYKILETQMLDSWYSKVSKILNILCRKQTGKTQGLLRLTRLFGQERSVKIFRDPDDPDWLMPC